MFRMLVILLSATLALFTVQPSESHAQARSTGTPTHSTPVAKKVHHEPLMMRLVNCEDYDIQPCWTYDDGAYRLVTSYHPYYSIKIRTVCKSEDGGPVLPCISKRNNRVAKGAPITRNLFI